MHTRLRGLASYAFTPRRVEILREHIREITDRLISEAEPRGHMDVISDLAEPLPAIVTAEMLGVPVSDHQCSRDGRRTSRRCWEIFSIIRTTSRAC